MSKRVTLVLIAFLLSLCLAQAARTLPVETRMTTFAKGHAAPEEVEECAGLEKEEECLERRTLAAHTDYIYTQGKHHR